tara:strand:+ start:2545 stop:3426 length:882 start_codon:yes stop_codon:yes gene_type:complete
LPELPEVETVRKGLEKKLDFFVIKRIEVLRSSTIAFPIEQSEFINGLFNSLILKWKRRGKYLIADLRKSRNNSDNNRDEYFTEANGLLVVHLRMTGYFNWFEVSTPPCKHTRIRFFDQADNELRFVDMRSFGKVWWIENGIAAGEVIKGLGSLGPEPFSKDFNINYLKQKFSKKTKSIKSLLLDQTVIAGIGNIYADESLFEAKISPFREAGTLNTSELIKLKNSIIEVLEKSIGSGGTTFSDFRDIEGSSGNFSLQTNVYRRTGKKCNKCNSLIEKNKISGRSTHWCRNCQK